MNNSLTVKNKWYEIIKVDTSNEFRTLYTLKDKNNILYRLLVEDYREASFMYDKFHTAVINQHGNGNLKTVIIEDIKLNPQKIYINKYGEDDWATPRGIPII